MINYSISLRANPSDQDAPKKAYANAQYSEIMTLDKFPSISRLTAPNTTVPTSRLS